MIIEKRGLILLEELHETGDPLSVFSKIKRALPGGESDLKKQCEQSYRGMKIHGIHRNLLRAQSRDHKLKCLQCHAGHSNV